ncbi:MAG TPA: D-alanine--D-alanine ligase [Gammaproteobacteria bacterium]|nr:D-alanine--D-alanine ligase [Gammaproteobacteria bacterium]
MSDAKRFGKVAVLMGGTSAEREVSLNSGQAVLDGLLRQGVDAHAVDITTPQDIVDLYQRSYERAFIVLHGRGGEDGQIQGALQTLGIPYTGSGVMGSAIAMDKYRTKLMWGGGGQPTPDYQLLRNSGDLELAAALGFPLMVKPANEGSSIGMSRVTTEAELESAWHVARQYDPIVIAERWITGSEYTVAILGREALPVIRLETPNKFYDYEAKYQSDETGYYIPSGLDSDREKRAQDLALEAFDAIGANGWGRVDMMIDETGGMWLIEINTVPGMTDHSLVPMAAKAQGISFDELVWKILQQTMEQT